jgi:hypothetical protein
MSYYGPHGVSEREVYRVRNPPGPSMRVEKDEATNERGDIRVMLRVEYRECLGSELECAERDAKSWSGECVHGARCEALWKASEA